MSGSAVFFPIVGALQGLLCILSAALLSRFFPADITSCLVLVILTITNGGFHLDGLADTFDAMAVKASGDKKADRGKRLSVMKDSTTGAIGVIAVVVAILLKYLLIKNLLLYPSYIPLYSFLFLMPVFSKWVMIPGMFHGISARQDGLGKIFINDTGIITVIFSSFSVILFCILTLSFYPDKTYFHKTIVLFPALFAVLYVFSFMSVKFCRKRFGGITGDNLGAISEISEILFLMLISLWRNL
jgi:adenosylcobinamide-GDP ribazoletransferase